MANWYISRNAIKARLGLSSAADDAVFDQIIESVSREIDDHCRRHFYTWEGARRFSPYETAYLKVDDLQAITLVKVDTGHDGTFATTWEAADFVLAPFNAKQQAEPEPYDEVRFTPGLVRYFPLGTETVEIVGRWGFFERLFPIDTLAVGVNDSATSIELTAVTPEVGHTYRIDNEQVFVSAAVGKVATVERGVNGTTPAAHLLGAAVKVYRYPVVSEACLHQTLLSYRAKDQSGGDGVTQGAPVTVGGLHPFVKRQLEKKVKVAVG